MAPGEDYDDETNIVFNVHNGDYNGEDYDDETDVIDDGVKGDNDDNGDETDAIGAVYNESNGVVHHI